MTEKSVRLKYENMRPGKQDFSDFSMALAERIAHPAARSDSSSCISFQNGSDMDRSEPIESVI